MFKDLVVLGGGEQASVIAEILLNEGSNLIAVVSPEPIKANSPLSGVKQLVSDQSLLSSYSPEEVELVNGLGAIPGQDLRWKLFDFYSNRGYRFASVISPHAILSKHLALEEGVQIMAGAIIQTNATIGKNCLINTGVIVEHDCKIGNHNHLAPGVTLNGSVTTADRVHIGTGANIVQGIKIGHGAVIGAGTSIVRDVAAGQVVIPAANRILL
ncbi:acetyltransferase [Pseudomonas sp. F1_0610]|uniref:acetyltransferase n=1 Tax=Pseudomonas sp. F1_0610 TaxID=3114284 RepID=UPI0039C475D6